MPIVEAKCLCCAVHGFCCLVTAYRGSQEHAILFDCLIYWPIAECEHPKRNQIDQRDKHQHRPEWRQAKPPENPPGRVQDDRNHHHKDDPMRKAVGCPPHPIVRHHGITSGWSVIELRNKMRILADRVGEDFPNIDVIGFVRDAV